MIFFEPWGVDMSTEVSNGLILDIGSLILKSAKYSDDQWQGLALVGDFANGMESMHGYVYFPDGGFEARTPAPSFDVMDKVQELRQEMKKEKNEEWCQCLIHITRPDYKINIKFEYDDPKRWSPKEVSRDMSEFAESIKPSL